MTTLTYDDACRVLDAARRAAAAESLTGAVVVVDAAGDELALAREAGSSWFTADVARAKARTAARFGRPTVALADLAGRFREVWEVAADRLDFRPVSLDGGVPLLRGDVLVGAVGVSGGMPDADRRCADAGAAALSPSEESR